MSMFIAPEVRLPLQPPFVLSLRCTLKVPKSFTSETEVCYKRRILTRPSELPELRFAVSLFFFVVLIHVTTIGASAQRFTFQHYDQDEGLKNHDVFKLMQDKTGFLWSATVVIDEDVV
jgi:hypothetical protein